jgi:hypothetical protein
MRAPLKSGAVCAGIRENLLLCYCDPEQGTAPEMKKPLAGLFTPPVAF